MPTSTSPTIMRPAAPVVQPLKSVSRREWQVASLLPRPNKVIAYELGISEWTVKGHLRVFCHKTGASNRTEAALIVARQQWLLQQWLLQQRRAA